MEIEEINFKNLHNGEHYQFHAQAGNLITKYTPTALGIADAHAAYQVAFTHEGQAIVLIQKSPITRLMTNKDYTRDELGRGLTHTLLGATYHYNNEVKQAALRLKVIFDHFGNFMDKPYGQESSDITNLVKEMNGNHAADVATVGLAGWLNALDTENNEFIALGSDRNTEGATKTVYRMKETRKEVDSAYGEIVKRINSLIVVNGQAAYKDFVNELNQEVAKQALIIAQRKGRNDKDDDDEAAADTTPTA